MLGLVGWIYNDIVKFLKCILVGYVVWAAPALAGDLSEGAAIFQSQCADCHGSGGQGGDGFEQPLFGNQSIHELAHYIEGAMPEGDPDMCVGDQAKAVAEFIYHDFYSPRARTEQGLPTAPRLDLLRLTVPQYRNSIADLILDFTPEAKTVDAGRRRRRKPDENDEYPVVPRLSLQAGDRGFHGQYFQSEGMTKTAKRRVARLDSKIAFDFCEGSPDPAIPPDQFCVIWEGSFYAHHTGTHEFKITSPNGVRLYVNLDPPERRGGLRDDSSSHGQQALIDGWVNSSEMRDLTARVFLIGGRYYPLRLEFFKYKEKLASIQLQWKPPHGVWTQLGDDNVIPNVLPRTFVVATNFPADDRSLGYERGSSVSREWHTATNQAAIQSAEEIIQRLPLLAGLDRRATTSDHVEEIKAFVMRFASKAFRRPLDDAEHQAFAEMFFQEGVDVETATKRAVLFLLKSPYFLYPEFAQLGNSSADYVVASRLALAIWDSLPDRELWRAAEAGELASPESLRNQTARMLNDARARAKMNGFFHHWLELDERDLMKDRKRYPEFDEAVIADLRRSLEQFVEQVVWSDSSDFRQLLQADELLLNSRLQSIYASPAGEQADPSGSDGFRSVSLPNQERSGVLTHPYLLSAFAYHNQTSPIHRGVFLTKNIVGRGLSAPPEAVAFKDDEFAANLTMREKVTQLTASKACMACHSIINPLGFALENYDAVGRWRTTEDEKPLNTVSEYLSREGQKIEVRNARDVAQLAIASPAAQQAFVAQLFHHVVKQDPLAYDRELLESLRQTFVENNFSIKNLFAEIAIQSSTRSTLATAGESPAESARSGPSANSD